MNNGGGGESCSNEIESCLNKRRRQNSEFARAIARIAVAQICESVGFQGFQTSALDTLSGVACKYIREIGKTSSFYASLAGRTECNVFDIVQGLEDLNMSQGFVGASDIDNWLSGSGIVKEIVQFVNLTEEIGFAYSVPSFPVSKERESTPSFLQAGETSLTDNNMNIPLWLPKFPQIRADKIDQERKVLEPPPSRNESVFPVIVEQGDVSGKEGLNNPFLAGPLRPGEKDVSLVSLPARLEEEDMVQNDSNRVSELDTFGPEYQEVRSGGNKAEEGSRKVVLNDRPAVKMKFHIVKKCVDTRKDASWFLNDEEERRMEKHSREPMGVEDHNGNDSVVN